MKTELKVKVIDKEKRTKTTGSTTDEENLKKNQKSVPT
jgi:hypothetical protein